MSKEDAFREERQNRAEEFREQKDKMEKPEEHLPVNVTKGLFELKDLVEELRAVRDAQFSKNTAFTEGPSIDGGHFNQLLRGLEDALALCLEEYYRMNALKNLSEAMTEAVMGRGLMATHPKIKPSYMQTNPEQFNFSRRDDE
jgi:hypothetical protein